MHCVTGVSALVLFIERPSSNKNGLPKEVLLSSVPTKCGGNGLLKEGLLFIVVIIRTLSVSIPYIV